eukprot:scaffold50906_cov56-Phaeocystis_antarctica.AAC.4
MIYRRCSTSLGLGQKATHFSGAFEPRLYRNPGGAPALPIREDETRAMLDHAGRVLADASSRDRTRHEVM